ncbi:MAG: Dipeptidyl peptidase IV [Cytophagales bacterium]|jgi:dipeptidyl aminopeptidase/acylaminoacyl peptidase|nr:prolyl oligopeptidase family serine peptidase [Bacteroidota bacterium]MBS1979731.1 prolyl oligopeptidase family serine peptidase [Bacteroidota bacterium]WHZ06986.1 MAG: Dipeptidyl peptidase IV [Cytophagales bacterium]
MKKIFFLLLVGVSANAQQLTELTVEKIMRDPKWMGVSPSAAFWAEDSKQVYFEWNPEKNEGDSLYAVSITNLNPTRVSPAARRLLPSFFGNYNQAKTKKVYEKNGDIFLLDIPSQKTTQVTNSVERESNPVFSFDERKILFLGNGNLFKWEIATGSISQLTDFRKGKKTEAKNSEQEKWLKADQLAYLQVLKERNAHKKLVEKMTKADRPKRPKEIYLDDKSAEIIQLSPDEKFITFRTGKNPHPKSTVVPNYVTESGFTEDIPSRTKVGAAQTMQDLYVYDIVKDTVLQVKTDQIPGITDTPEFKKDYPAKEKKDKTQVRAVFFQQLMWSADGKNNLLSIRSLDNKDRWIMSLDVATQKLKLIDRQHDDAWIGGPGTGGFFQGTNIGWVNNTTVWFHSEESGYSHLYTVDIASGKKTALTSGKYEVQQAHLSNDKKYFYLTTNEVHPGEKHFYKLPATGGKAEKITSLTGSHEVSISPDEKWIAYRYSYSNKPWELFLQENKPNAKPQQVTHSLSNEFNSYAWRDPIVTTFKARDGADVYTRLYKPAKPNGAAVVFVHGAGYLQNAHKWWSSYFREYMFHNLLADKGYTVLDMDYRASAGYGRDWRTGIYRFMGGKDLTDQVDGAKWLADHHGIDPKRIGIYGGSYGGFITLMAMFTTPDVFAAGAALRPVTDWAHYNHGYTSNILNEPFTDSLAYEKSSPIYHAAGLKGHLLICHGMVDTNVHFQEAVRLSQRLIELGKDNWELAAYPMEDHGFVEPSSWTDEYKRILKLFEDNLKK